MEGEDLSINALQRYDDDAIKLLFEQYYTPLVLFGKGYVDDLDASKDIVQEVFTVLIEAKEKFASIDNLKAYLYQATRNRCLKYLRHEEVKKKYAEDVLHGSEEYYLNGILEEEVYHHLMKAISELPEQCRKVFLLVLENKSNQEIADILSLQVETVKSYKKAGKKMLYERLKHVVPAAGLTFLFYI
ncbi:MULTISPECIES: RNA polymerase sigma-70 factor [Butyricimonas]|uniref:RNA polymerase sigma-70 factor n=1 Tax=Butyricimonas hominis TaxID=2763032 RepID=A0ABR7D3Z4_9BACT|nr:RNA polymerase sigma-70 factor [Butyricimonas sp.]MBC5622225.1 RNA polymerase sigma-70 factor [Butyricimonas hominis]